MAASCSGLQHSGYVNNLLIGSLNMVLSDCGDFSCNLVVDSLAVASEEQTVVLIQSMKITLMLLI